MSELQQEAKEALSKLQNFDAESLEQRSRLGDALRFTEVIDIAQSAIDVAKRLPTSVIEELPTQAVQTIRDSCTNVYNTFQEVLGFDVSQENPKKAKEDIERKFENLRDNLFNHLHPWISYAATRTIDFEQLEARSQEIIQSIRIKAEEASAQIRKYQEEAEAALDRLRSTLNRMVFSKC